MYKHHRQALIWWDLRRKQPVCRPWSRSTGGQRAVGDKDCKLSHICRCADHGGLLVGCCGGLARQCAPQGAQLSQRRSQDGLWNVQQIVEKFFFEQGIEFDVDYRLWAGFQGLGGKMELVLSPSASQNPWLDDRKAKTWAPGRVFPLVLMFSQDHRRSANWQSLQWDRLWGAE